jgi:hypothetical protein
MCATYVIFKTLPRVNNGSIGENSSNLVTLLKIEKLGRLLAVLPDLSWSKHTKIEKVYQMTTNYTKRPYNVPNVHKLIQTAVKYTTNFHSMALQNIPKLRFLVLK